MLKKIILLFVVITTFLTLSVNAFALSGSGEQYASYADFNLSFAYNDSNYEIGLTDFVYDTTELERITTNEVTFSKLGHGVTSPGGLSDPGRVSYNLYSEIPLTDFQIRSDQFVFHKNNTSPVIVLPSGWIGVVSVHAICTSTNSQFSQNYEKTYELTDGGPVFLFEHDTDTMSDYVYVSSYVATFTFGTPSTFTTTLNGKWTLNSDITLGGYDGVQPINFTCSGNTYEAFVIGSNQIYYRVVADSNSGQTLAYRGGTWFNDSYLNIDFGTTPQTVNAAFYEWFVAHATPSIPLFDVVFSYDINNIVVVSSSNRSFFAERGEYQYNRGYADGMEFKDTDWTSWIATAVSGFFCAELFPGFSLGGILSVLIGILLVFAYLRYFR